MIFTPRQTSYNISFIVAKSFEQIYVLYVDERKKKIILFLLQFRLTCGYRNSPICPHLGYGTVLRSLLPIKLAQSICRKQFTELHYRLLSEHNGQKTEGFVVSGRDLCWQSVRGTPLCSRLQPCETLNVFIIRNIN